MKNKDLAKVCYFKIENNKVLYSKTIKTEEKEEILKVFNENIKKYTFLGLILPCGSFLTIFLITALYLISNEYKGNFNTLIFVIFITFLFGFLGIALLYKILIKRDKCYLTMKYNSYRYKYISKDEYEKICCFLKERVNHEKKL